MNRPTMKRLALVCALFTLATACAQAPSTATPPSSSSDATASQPPREQITLMLDWTPNTNHTGIYAAEQLGWYDDAGLDVEIVQPGEQGGLAALGAGRADVAVSVQEAVVPARAQGAPIVSIGAIIASNTSALMALAGEGIKNPGDLPGHRYGGFGGQLETALISELVRCAGGDPDAVEYVEVGNVDYRVGLQRDFYDFVWIFEGWDGIRLQQADGVNVALLPFADELDCIPDWYTPLFASTEQTLEERGEALRRFMKVTAKGYQLAMDEPDRAADLLLQAAPELDPELVRASARYLSTRYAAEGSPWGVQEDAVWTRFVSFLKDAGLIDELIDVDAAYTNELLPEQQE
ncbi:MAG: ABC transporter substrate-binding protein [Egibacteraceae bacterium]